MAQRIQFLEAKGLAPAEIDLALKQAALRNANVPIPAPYPAAYGPNPYIPPAQGWDWRDYFVRGACIEPQITRAYAIVVADYWYNFRCRYLWSRGSFQGTYLLSGKCDVGSCLWQKYLLPHLQPPTATAYEEDRDALNAQFDAAEALLKEIQNETAAVRAAVEEQKEKIDQTTDDVKAVVVEMREGETKTRDEMREIREEVNNIREMLPKASALLP